MLRSQLLQQASMDDIYESMALDIVRDPEQRSRLTIDLNVEAQSQRTPKEQEVWILSQLPED